MAALCLLVGLLSLAALPPAVRVLSGYRPELPAVAAPDLPGPRLAERVVVVVLSGVSNVDFDAAGDPWRFLQVRRRAAEGAYGSARAALPSGDAPTWAALLSGADATHSGVVDRRASLPSAVPTLFDEARRAGLRSMVVMSRVAWQARATVARPDRIALAPSSSGVAGLAASLLRSRSERVVFALLDAGRADSVPAAERWSRLDGQFATIAAGLDLARDTLIVTGDHGFLADGASGGDERVVVDVPLVLWGRAVSQTAIGTVEQRDIAPTISALLGLPYSPYAGRPIIEALRLSPQGGAAEYLRLLEVRAHSAQNSSDEAMRWLREARTLFARSNWGGATKTVRAGLASLDRTPPLPWYWTSVWMWGGVAPLLLLGLGRLTGRFRRPLRRLVLPVAGLVAYLLTWATIYVVLAGKTFSLSAIYGDWSTNLLAIGVWSALALAVVAAGLGFVRAKEGARAAAFDLGLAALLVLGLLIALVLLYLVVAGAPHSALPGLAGWTMLLLAVTLAAGVGIATPLAMLIAAAVGEIGARGR